MARRCKRWTPNEDRLLIKHYADHAGNDLRIEELAAQLRRSINAVQQRGQRLGLSDQHRPRAIGKRNKWWKGDAATPQAKRMRAQLRFPLGKCQRCKNKDATDRHHKDGHPGNNAPKNIQILCRRCHMVVDGRLAKLPSYPARSVISPCVNCGFIQNHKTRGLCYACSQYQQRTGKMRPPQGLKKRIKKPMTMPQ